MPSIPKPLRGERRIELKERRHDRRAEEDAEKEICRRRDKRCRYPHCPYCRRYRDLIPQAAHVIQAKGMSGDRRMERSMANQLMLLCQPIHGLQEQHQIEIVPLDPERGTDGACEFWREDIPGQKYLVARETAPFIYERD